jgi:peptide subunit release factor 1 (eRF1)
MKAIKANMKDQILTKDRKILHCPECGVEYSGSAGDYWNAPDDHVFICECGCEMELVEKIVTVQYV